MNVCVHLNRYGYLPNLIIRNQVDKYIYIDMRG